MSKLYFCAPRRLAARRAGLRLLVVQWANPRLSSYLSTSWAYIHRVVFLGLLFSRPLISTSFFRPMRGCPHVVSAPHQLARKTNCASTEFHLYHDKLTARGIQLYADRDHTWLLVQHQVQERVVPGAHSLGAEILSLRSCLWYRAIISCRSLEVAW